MRTLFLYLLRGIGISAGPFGSLTSQWFGRAGFGTFFIVNVMLPVAAIGLGAAHARPRVAAAGGVLLALGLVVEVMLRAQPNPMMWNAGLLLGASHPILVAAAVGYAALGAGAAWLSLLLRAEFHRPANGSPEKSF